MALNSFVTKTGDEMGRAQVTQAECAGIEPTVDMNPILIKPSSDTGAQVIVRGKPIGNFDAMKYHTYKPRLINIIKQSFGNLARDNDIIVIEGAGSPAEINLRANDVVNMKIAQIFDSPVVLVGDINLGGVFAWLAGTLNLLTPQERARVKGVIINKFRGDLEILKPGLKMLEKIIHKPVLGVVPYFHDIRIPEEDSVSFDNYRKTDDKTSSTVKIEVLYLPHISNFTDFDPLEHESGVSLRYVRPGEKIGNPDCLIIPGSKNTISDLLFLQKHGYADEIIEKSKKQTVVMGVCGGYQMLGREINDPYCIETTQKKVVGLGLLPISTTIFKHKMTHQVYAHDKIFNTGIVRGYEIHMGKSTNLTKSDHCFEIFKQSDRKVKVKDGTISKSNNVFGTYIHGLFENDNFRKRFVNHLTSHNSGNVAIPVSYEQYKETEYDKLADLVRNNIDINQIYSIIKK
jgi:adenosylcobyric acid synthase